MPDTPAASGEGAARDEVIAGLRAANARLRDLLEQRDARIAGLEARAAETGALRALVAELQAQVADLAAQVKQTSKNSSKPPSSDGLGLPEPKSLRKKTGRKPGRPKGQPGATMELTDHPGRVIGHEPDACAGCGAGLDAAPQTGLERRQATEIPGTPPSSATWSPGTGTSPLPGSPRTCTGALHALRRPGESGVFFAGSAWTRPWRSSRLVADEVSVGEALGCRRLGQAGGPGRWPLPVRPEMAHVSFALMDLS